MLPPALHPTVPPVAGISVIEVQESEWGPFEIAQLRIECRSGLRPHSLLALAVTDIPRAGQALIDRFGFCIPEGEVTLDRAYHEMFIGVAVDGEAWILGAMRGPMQVDEGATQLALQHASGRNAERIPTGPSGHTLCGSPR